MWETGVATNWEKINAMVGTWAGWQDRSTGPSYQHISSTIYIVTKHLVKIGAMGHPQM
jgi:hypothetical protein